MGSVCVSFASLRRLLLFEYFFLQLVAHIATGFSVLVGNVCAHIHLAFGWALLYTWQGHIRCGFAVRAWLTTQEAEQVP